MAIDDAVHHWAHKHPNAHKPAFLAGGLVPVGANGAPTMTAAAKTLISVEVVSDTVCPWCFLGKRRLERAMRALADRAEFRVKWLPFQLNAAAPEEGVSKMQMYNDKFGPGRVAQMVPAMTANFAAEGLEYSMGGLTGNTRNSHRLLAWAAHAHGLDAQNALAEQLFRGYFTQERFINDIAFLLEAAQAAGLPADGAAAALSDDQLVRAELGKYAGISGVPHFVINGRHHLGGAQPPEAFMELFERLLEQQAPTGDGGGGGA